MQLLSCFVPASVEARWVD